MLPEFPSPTPPFAAGTGLPRDVPVVDEASKGVADYLMLRRKLPDEIVAGRTRRLPKGEGTSPLCACKTPS